MKLSISFLFTYCFIALSIGTQSQYITETIPLPNQKVQGIELGQKDNIYICTNRKGIFHSNEHNINWQNLGLEDFLAHDMCLDTNQQLYTTARAFPDGGIYTYKNNRWEKKYSNFENALSIECSPYSNTIFSTGPTDDPYIDSTFFIMSQDGGDTWTLTYYYYSGTEFIQDFCFQSIDTMFAASVEWVLQDSGGVYRSTDGGYHWKLFGLEGCDVQDLHIHKNYLYAAVRTTYSTTYTRDGIYRYPLDKEEDTWQFVYPHIAFGVASDSQGTLYGLCVQNNYRMGIVASPDGRTWHTIEGGPQHVYNQSLYYKISVSPNDMIYFLAYDYTHANLYRMRPFDGSNELGSKPSEWVSEAYPNPCGSTTSFNINTEAHNTLSLLIYNSCGQLQNNTRYSYPQGSNTLNINTTALAAGVYICHFNNGKQVVRRKLVKR